MAQLDVYFGPPGTGKSTTLSGLVHRYGEQDGSDGIVVSAFTRTAAQELAGRKLGIPKHHLGTLHALGWHGLDTPPIAETHWQDWTTAYPLYPLSDQEASDTADPGSRLHHWGDNLLAEVNINRHRLLPVERWSEAARDFWRLWDDWKRQHAYIDYTDMIDLARTLMPIAPGHPHTLIVDEAQDVSLLQWELLHQWARHVDRFICAGDDDQCLYRVYGADFRPLLAAPSRTVLPQSYRVPQAIQPQALHYVNQITYRAPKSWGPRDAVGALEYHQGHWKRPQQWVRYIEEWLETTAQTIAVIAPCGYMLHPLLAVLRERGIPFANKWRRKQRTWNPLLPPKRGIGMPQRLRDFLRPPDRLWSWPELTMWLDLVRVEGILQRGAKAHLRRQADAVGVCTLQDLQQLFLPEALEGALTGGLAWLEREVLPSRATTLAYPARVVHRYGREALLQEPRLTIGTAHSLKGAEADIVLFFNELSPAQTQALRRGGDDADDVRRMLYVAVTRAKNTLWIIENGRGDRPAPSRLVPPRPLPAPPAGTLRSPLPSQRPHTPPPPAAGLPPRWCPDGGNHVWLSHGTDRRCARCNATQTLQ